MFYATTELNIQSKIGKAMFRPSRLSLLISFIESMRIAIQLTLRNPTMYDLKEIH
jgi:hypothetical protein